MTIFVVKFVYSDGGVDEMTVCATEQAAFRNVIQKINNMPPQMRIRVYDMRTDIHPQHWADSWDGDLITISEHEVMV